MMCRKGSVAQGKCSSDMTVCVCVRRWTHLEKTDDAWKVRSQHHFLLLGEVPKHESGVCVFGG